MNQPIDQRVSAIENRLRQVEDQVNDWQYWKSITRDSSYKIGIAEGLASSLQRDVLQIKVDLAKVSQQMATVIDQQVNAKMEADQRHDEVTKKLDLILKLLQPGGE